MDGAADTRELAPGTMLDDKYRIERLIAHGGMGAVYLGTHTKLRKRVAIKLLNPQMSSPAMIERFHREAITASQIGHEGIAQVTDLGTSMANEPFLVMEYLEGESLATRIKASGPMPIEVACEMGCSILSPLAAAHAAGIVHRDLKPDNVFLVRQSRGEMVKLLDFGISRTQGLEGEFRLTTTGLVLGTPYYMSPEQARGQSEVSPAADIYAFGVMLYEMLVGAVPISGTNYNQLMYRVMTGEYVRARERRPDLPEALEQLISQAMALEPEQRPQSASQLEMYLLQFCRPTFRDHTIEKLSSPSLNSIGVATPMPTPSYRPSATSPPVVARPPQAFVPTQPGSVKKRSVLPFVLGGLALAAVAIAVVVKMSGSEPTTSAAAAPTPSEPAVAKTVTPTPTPPTPTPTPPATTPPDPPPVEEAKKITLRFELDPANAIVTIDDKAVPDPSSIEVVKDTGEHKLHVTAQGFTAHDTTIHYDENQRLSIVLKKAPAVVRPGTKKPKSNERIDTESPY